jgi:hypothetical protein
MPYLHTWVEMKLLLGITFGLILWPSLGTGQTKPNRRPRPSTRQKLKAQADAKFVYAIEKGDVAVFYSLLKHGADVNARRENRTTALMVAALNGRTEFLVVLLSKGARVNAKNTFGNTALMDAASFGQVEMVRWLLIAGANVRATNESGWTALMFASKSAYARQENYQRVVELLQTHETKRRSQSRRA